MKYQPVCNNAGCFFIVGGAFYGKGEENGGRVDGQAQEGAPRDKHDTQEHYGGDAGKRTPRTHGVRAKA